MLGNGCIRNITLVFCVAPPRRLMLGVENVLFWGAKRRAGELGVREMLS